MVGKSLYGAYATVLRRVFGSVDRGLIALMCGIDQRPENEG